MVPGLVNTADSILPTCLSSFPPYPTHIFTRRGELTVDLLKLRYQGPSLAQAPRVLRVQRVLGGKGKPGYQQEVFVLTQFWLTV